MSTPTISKFTSLARARKPDALELFTDRTDEQQLLRRVISASPTGDLEGGWTNLLTVFYGVGGVGKTTLRKQARKIARDEFPDCTCVVSDFDGEGWTSEKGATQIFAELCRGLLAEKIAPVLTLTLLALDRHSGEKGVSLEDRYGLVFTALDKGVEWASIPGLGEAMKGVRWLAKQAYARSIRDRINELNLSPDEHEGKVNLLDLQAKLPLALFHDVSSWLEEKPGRQLVWLLDGYERIQSRRMANDAQSRLREFIREFGAQQQGGLRVVTFGREQLNWGELYQEPWSDFSTEHCLGGLAEADARHFLAKSQAWLQGHGQGPLADGIARYTDRILDASDERLQGQRVFYPFYLNLSLDLVERALAARREPDLGGSPAELQERFFRYLGAQEKRALQVLSLAEVFDADLFDWLVTRQLVAGFTVHGFDAELRKERSYFLPVERQPGRWKFHKLMEDALHASCRSPAAERVQGQQLVRQLLGYFGDPLKDKPEGDWTDADAEGWRRGTEIIVTQGPELGLLETEQWDQLQKKKPWSVEHFRTLDARVDFGRRILKEHERLSGADHPDTLMGLNNLAILLWNQGDYAGAEQLHRRALAGREKALGLDHPDTLSSLNNLAILLSDQGDYAGAETLYRRALAGQEKALGPDHHDTLGSVNNLANLLHRQGDYAGAEPLYRRALAGSEKALGPDHPNTLSSLNNLATLLSDQGDYAGAETLYRRALAGQEKALGPDHPNTLSSLNNLATLLSDQGDYAGAEPLYRRALAGKEKALGPDHPNTLSSLNNLATLLSDQGDYAGAETLCRRALAGQEKALGLDHPDTLSSVNNLANLLRNHGDYAGAKALHLRALEGRGKALGAEHPDTLSSLNNLAILLSDQGDYAGAEPLYRRALAGKEKALGPDHPSTVSIVNNLAILLHRQGDYAGAETLYRRALAGQEKALGPDHPDTLDTVNKLAVLLWKFGDYQGAEALYRRALAGREKALGPDHPNALTSLNNLANLLQLQGMYAGAEPLYLRALAGRENSLGPEHRDTLESVNDLASCINQSGCLPEALDLLRKYAAKSPIALTGVRYNLACYECLSGNHDDARCLIADEISAHPEKKDQALKDSDLAAIHPFIESR